jgi:hypothetical protein
MPVCNQPDCEKAQEDQPQTNFHKAGSGYRRDCKTCKNAKKRQYYADHREEIRERQSQYNTSEHGRELRRARNHKRNATEQGRLENNLRCRLYKFLKGKSNSQASQDLVGCTRDEYIAHIESHFEEGMNWNNYGCGKGKWTLDHTVPFKAFRTYDGELEQHQKVLCWYKNVRPMWFKDNVVKYDSYTEDAKKALIKAYQEDEILRECMLLN